MHESLSTRHADVISAARRFRTIIGYLSAALVALFGWLSISKLQVVQAVAGVPAELIHRATMFLYFIAWVLGTRKDLDLEEVAFVRLPNKNANAGVIIALLLGVVFCGMCAVSPQPIFVALLAAFLALDVIGWLYLRKLLAPAYRESNEVFAQQNNREALFRLGLTYRYVTGSWKIKRYVCMGTLLIVVFLLFRSDVQRFLQQLGLELPASSFPSLGVLAYVIIAEYWQWTYRLRCAYCHDEIEVFVQAMEREARTAEEKHG
jgi:hypothetical protein